MTHPLKFVVGIGASAGGLEAIQEFFNHLPKTNEFAFIIVQHLSPDHTSMMRELLAHNTSIPIISVKQNRILKTGVVYLIPATYEARIEKNHFKLSKLKRGSLSLPINTLFGSIAEAYKQYSLGVILSGTGSDGAVGITQIARNGGLTIAQLPMEAKFPGMPNKAIATREINYILPTSEMPDIIMEYTKQPSEFNKNIKQTEPPNKREYSEIFHLIDEKFHLNFSSYKIGTVSRRIQRRMQLLGIEKLHAYLDYLKKDNEGISTLYQDLLIGVTDFFRDKEAFAELESEVIPKLFTKFKATQEEIRVWVNPCATGEEAYTIAILFKKYADESKLPVSVKIFASDIFNDFIQTAKKGIYSYKSVANIPSDLLKKYFVKFKDHYEVIPEIRKQILFTTHNLLRDPPFAKMDLVCCRNLLIYINPKEQKRITDILRFCLNINGFLFLGPSERVALLDPDLIVQNQTWKIYKKVQRSNLPISTTRLVEPMSKIPIVATSRAPNMELPLYAYNTILHDVVSAGFIIDTSYVILHTIGEARELLMLPEGIPSLILPKIIIEDLKGALIAALHKVKNTLIPVLYSNITIHPAHSKPRSIKMAVHPICDTKNNLEYYWVRLDRVKLTTKKQEKIIISSPQRDVHIDEIVIALEGELSDTRALLQSSVEQMEAVNEEIQSTNEELVASNEELQSTNEELLSVNEELYTVNLELSKKIEEANQAKTDLDNLIRAAEICTIILNSNLEIRMFTPAIEKIFNLVGHDIGRSLENFRHNLEFDLLTVKAQEVLKNHTAYETEVKNKQNRWYFLKIFPYYSTMERAVTGVVITLTDIHETKLLKQAKEETEQNLRMALQSGLIGIWQCDLRTESFTYDETIKTIFGLSNLTSMKRFKHFLTAIHPDDRKRLEKAFAIAIEQDENIEQNFRVIRPDRAVRYIYCSANVHHNLVSNSDYVTGICWDMTEKYWLEEKVIDAERLNLGLDAITDGWWDWNLIDQETYLSPLLKKTMGYEDHEIPNRMESFEQMMLSEDLAVLRTKMEKYIANNSTQPLIQELRFKHKDGSIVWILSRRRGIVDKKGRLVRMIGTISNITALKETEKTLEQLAYHDSLTEIPNRSVFFDSINRAIERAKRNKGIFAVIFLDLDDFKSINDKWGHGVGDTVLCEVTKRLINSSRTVDLLARLGGDEFGILVEDIENAEEVHLIAARYVSVFAEPLKINGNEMQYPVTIAG